MHKWFQTNIYNFAVASVAVADADADAVAVLSVFDVGAGCLVIHHLFYILMDFNDN